MLGLAAAPLDRQIRKLCYRRYETARAYELWKRSRQGKGRKAVLVYQIGKVGSSTVAGSLRAVPGMTAYQVHYLSIEALQRMESRAARRFDGKRALQEHLIDALQVRSLLDQEARGGPWKVITLVRDPVSWSISQRFQRLGGELEFLLRCRTGEVEALTAELVPELRRRFLKADARWRAWFDRELRAVFGLDLLAAPFPRDEGYCRYSVPNAEILVLKLERLDDVGSEAVRQLLGLADFQAKRENDAGRKAYHEVYQSVKRSLVVPAEDLDRIYSAPYVRHFYSDAEIDTFRRRWRTS